MLTFRALVPVVTKLILFEKHEQANTACSGFSFILVITGLNFSFSCTLASFVLNNRFYLF